MADWELPTRGVVFWPVGNGDSTTIVVDEDTVIQVDLCQYDASEDPDDPRVPVVDRLAEVLPRAQDGKTPRLAVLAISHHDRDHSSGFDEMCGDGFQVDEMWLTLRSFVEDKDTDEGLSEEGKLVYKEAKRRRDAEIKAAKDGKRAPVGDRLRIIGREDLLEDDDWKDFPPGLLTRAGNLVPLINGEDRSDVIDVFIHTPFHEPDGDDDRNSSSLGMRVTLKDGDCEQKFLLLGDLDHKKVEAFIQKSIARGNEEHLPWDYLLAPHHGSRNAIMRKDGDKWVKADAYFSLQEHMEDGAMIIISARSIDEVSDGDTNPPHEEAIKSYNEMAGKNVMLTADYAKGNDSEPIVIDVTAESCGECRESTRAWKARMGTMTGLTGASVRPGDDRGAGGRQEFA
jgi:beta-lactamase superfamily II metal-dependent hydrolase